MTTTLKLKDARKVSKPQTDLKTVLESEIKEWHFRRWKSQNHDILLKRTPSPPPPSPVPSILVMMPPRIDIYFHQNNSEEHQAALKLRDAVLCLRRDGAFVAVPLFRVNTGPIGPHPVGSYEIWCPSETFSAVYSYMCLNRGNLSVLIHPLTRQQRIDHEDRVAWLGQSYGLDLSTLPVYSEELPSQYSSLGLGYAAPTLSIKDRLKIGANVEAILSTDKDAAKAPPRNM